MTPPTAATDVFGGSTDLAGNPWTPYAYGLPPITYPVGPGRPSGTVEPEVTRRATPSVVVWLRGRAARVKWGIEPPRLVSVNGVKAVPANRIGYGEGYGTMVRMGAAGTRVCIGRWNLRYRLESMPSGRLPEPPNPLFG